MGRQYSGVVITLRRLSSGSEEAMLFLVRVGGLNNAKLVALASNRYLARYSICRLGNSEDEETRLYYY